MSKKHYFSNKFSKIALFFDFSDLKLCDFVKLCFFKLIMTKSNFKKSVMTSFQWRHIIMSPKNATKSTSQDFPFWAPPSEDSYDAIWLLFTVIFF